MDLGNYKQNFTQTLAPSGNFASPVSIYQAFVDMIREVTGSSSNTRLAAFGYLKKVFGQKYGLKSAFFFGSGKESLLRVFQAVSNTNCGKDVIVMSAYTCPDIASAAVAAGFRVLAVDIVHDTLEMDIEAMLDRCPKVLESVAAVVLSNLFGMVDEIEPWVKLQQKYGFILIDDGCQSFLSKDKSHHVGARPSTVGIISFGRGKAFCGLGGGAVLFSQESGAEIESEVQLWVDRASSQSSTVLMCFLQELVDIGRMFTYWLFERPQLYWLPERMPFLGLGETTYKTSINISRLSITMLASCLAKMRESGDLGIERVLKASELHELIDTQAFVEPFIIRSRRTIHGLMIPNRYPILCKDKLTRNTCYHELCKLGLGASVSYNKALTGFTELKPHLVDNDCDVAEDIAQRLLTLPVHRFVRRCDMEKSTQVLNTVVRMV